MCRTARLSPNWQQELRKRLRLRQSLEAIVNLYWGELWLDLMLLSAQSDSCQCGNAEPTASWWHLTGCDMLLDVWESAVLFLSVLGIDWELVLQRCSPSFHPPQFHWSSLVSNTLKRERHIWVQHTRTYLTHSEAAAAEKPQLLLEPKLTWFKGTCLHCNELW